MAWHWRPRREAPAAWETAVDAYARALGLDTLRVDALTRARTEDTPPEEDT
jgi:hypothetical protein